VNNRKSPYQLLEVEYNNKMLYSFKAEVSFRVLKRLAGQTLAKARESLPTTFRVRVRNAMNPPTDHFGEAKLTGCSCKQQTQFFPAVLQGDVLEFP
jgi:hypothetical protein